MPGNARSHWFYPWVPLGIATMLGGLLVWLLMLTPSSQVRAAEVELSTPAGMTTTGKKLLVAVTLTCPEEHRGRLRGLLRAELLDRQNKVVDRMEQSIDQDSLAQAYRFEFPTPSGSLDGLRVRYSFGKARLEESLSEILLAKAHETTLAAGQEFHAGSPASLRCEVHGVKSMSESVPISGATIDVRLRSKDGKKVYELTSDRTGADGTAQVRFKVPTVAAGQYTMEVATRSGLGEEKLSRDVTVKAEPKILLVTDKPLYQPGQLIHIRALTLGAFDLKPAANAQLTFEVEDSKGNKVFKRENTTSEYGVASVDFQLADEVNQGDYRIRAILGDGKTQADKTVTVKPYVLPKFKAELKADKQFYLPKETVKADLQVDYFFGKPVAKSKVKVTASTFDVAFKDFLTWEGTTDERGHVKFEVKLPDYFVGQPLQKGNALLKLEVKVTDTADHSESITKTYTVSDQPIKVSLIPEAGRLVPGVENRVFAAAIYPDGSPARADVKIWFATAKPQAPGFVPGGAAPGLRRGVPAPALPGGAPAPVPGGGQPVLGAEDKKAAPEQPKPFAELKTSEAGLAEFIFTPRADQFRPGEWGMQNVEALGGNRQVWAPKNLLDLRAEVRDAKGNSASTVATLSSEPLGQNVLLRLDKAIYKGGDTLNIDIRSSAGLPTVYLDLIKNGQVMLTEWLDVKDGKAQRKLTLPAEVFGTLEVHSYQMLASGEIIRDSRVVYVQPASDLKIKIEADKSEYKPGAEGKIRFAVTDAAGKPTAAALGVIIVDEAVYALQEMQPGLEKVYFTLQEELLKPQAQAIYKPSEPLDVLVREDELAPARQQIAQVLLTAIQPKLPARWEVTPSLQRRLAYAQRFIQIKFAVWNRAQQGTFQTYDKTAKAWKFQKDLLESMINKGELPKEALIDPLGGQFTLNSLEQLDKSFSAEQVARAFTSARQQSMVHFVGQHVQTNRAKWFKEGKWNLPKDVLSVALKAVLGNDMLLRDGWGQDMQLVKHEKKLANNSGFDLFDFHEITSAGPDGQMGTADDVRQFQPASWEHGAGWWGDGNEAEGVEIDRLARLNLDVRDKRALRERGGGIGGGPMPGGGGGFAGGFGGGGPPGAPMPLAAPRGGVILEMAANSGPVADSAPVSSGPAPTRLREYFPETMLWQPSLVTDDKGIAVLPVNFADSITTWRLTASASSRGGLLGGTTMPLRVFQDFFVDLDLPVALTQNDEVAFPVAIYNYLKDPQTVTLELEQENWFTLLEGGLVRKLELKPGEVTSIKFRIKASKIGNFPLTVWARGSKMSDAIKRSIEVIPDGQKVEQVVTDRLTGKIVKSIVIPDNAVPEASKLIVKLYPGIFSQILEGVEGLIRLPGG